MKRGSITGILLLVLAGCQKNPSHEIIFNDLQTQEVNVEVSSCTFIKSVDGEEIKPFMIQQDKIILPGKTVECGTYEADQLGTIEITYRMDQQIFKKLITIVDTIKPEIIAKDTYRVEKGNEYFKIEDEIKFSDNYNQDFFTSIEHNIDLNEVGNYEVLVKAKDSSGNENQKKIIVEVVDKEKEIVVVEVPISSNGNNGTASTSNPLLSSGQKPNPSKPYINGVTNLNIKQGTTIQELVSLLSSGITASSSVTIDYTQVNLSVPGQYRVFYQGTDGASASCIVTVNE